MPYSSPVQDSVQGVVASGSSISYASTPTPGNLLIAWVFDETSVSQPVVSDTLNGNWTLLGSGSTKGTASIGLWAFGMLAAASQPKPVTVTRTGDTFEVALQEWSGNPNSLSGIVAQSNIGSASSTTASSGAQIATSGTQAPYDLILTGMGTSNTIPSPTISDTNGWTYNEDVIVPGGGVRLALGYLVPGAAGTFNPVFNWTTNSRTSVQVVLALQAAIVLTGSASISLSAAVTGKPTLTSTASGSISLLAAVSVAKPEQPTPDNAAPTMWLPFVPGRPRPQALRGTATASISLSAGALPAVATGAASLSLSAASAGSPGFTSSGIGSLSISAGTVSGVQGFSGSAPASITLAAAATGKPALSATASGAIVLYGSEVGGGTGAADLELLGGVIGAHSVGGTAPAFVSIAAGPVAPVIGVSGAIALSASASGAPQFSGNGSTASVSLTASGAGTPSLTQMGYGDLELFGYCVGTGKSSITLAAFISVSAQVTSGAVDFGPSITVVNLTVVGPRYNVTLEAGLPAISP
jgi:hypothetical protein